MHRNHPAGKQTRATSVFAGLGLLGLLALLTSACASEHPLDTLTTDSSPDAERINNLFFPVLAVAIVVGILVLGAAVYMIFRFRTKRSKAADPYDPDSPNLDILEEESLPEQTHGNVRLEIAWTLIPAVILVVISIFTLITIFEIHEVEAAPDDMRVTVVGQQWWWEFQYHVDGDTESPPDFVTANELVIPVGQQIPLEITARDVIHSFWIPRLNGKMDAVPGRENDWLIEASRPGTYLGQCTEFCGLSHGYMKMSTVALSPLEWESWALNQMKAARVLTEGERGFEGQEIFMQNCARCHSIAGVTDSNDDEQTDSWEIYNGADFVNDELKSGAAPNLTHFASRSSFAGGIFDTYTNIDDLSYLSVAQQGNLNRRDLEMWVRNAPGQKPADAEDSRGMPAFSNLTPEDIDAVVEYLMELN